MVASVSSMNDGGILKHEFGDKCRCDKKRDETISYRGINLRIKEFLEMRNVIHQKIEQVFSTSN